MFDLATGFIYKSLSVGVLLHVATAELVFQQRSSMFYVLQPNLIPFYLNAHTRYL